VIRPSSFKLSLSITPDALLNQNTYINLVVPDGKGVPIFDFGGLEIPTSPTSSKDNPLKLEASSRVPNVSTILHPKGLKSLPQNSTPNALSL
ncbi:hypothetical protein HN873_028859, partial [Arachis hypogaea]